MANVLQISLESLLLRATNPNNPNIDKAALNAFFALINKEREGPSVGVRVIASRLPAGPEKEVLTTLDILDMCLSKCGSSFQNEVGKFRFLNEMIKLVSPKYLGSKTPLSVKQRVLQLLYLWTLDYPKEVKIKEAFDMLRKQGVIREIPNPNIPQEAIGIESKRRVGSSVFHDEEKSNILRKLLQSKDPEDIQAANWLIKSMVKEEEKLSDLKSKTLTDLESVQNNIKLLNEMIGSFKDGDTTKSELDLMSELHDNIVRFKPNLKSMASSDESGPVDLLETVLKTMDEVTECLNKYNGTVLNLKTGSSKSNLASLLELDQQSVGSSLIQMEQNKELKNGADDSCSSHNGSSQTSLVSSSTTSKSSMDVLCDVFSGLGEASKCSDILQPVAAIENSESLKSERDKGKQKKLKALEDLDVLSEHLKKENLPFCNYRTQEKIPMNLLSKINEIKKSQQQNEPVVESSKLDLNYLLENPSLASISKSEENFTVDNTDDCLVDITEEGSLDEMPSLSDIQNEGQSATEPEGRISCPIKLKDISIKLEDIKPSSNKSIVALDDKNGLSILLHKGVATAWPLVSVYVITTVSKNELPLTNFLFQPVVPKGCKLRLLPPSSTELPAFNPFLPSAAYITQIMLILNETKRKDIILKFIVSYVVDDETVTEMGEVKEVPLETTKEA